MKHNFLNAVTEMSQVKSGTLYLISDERVGRQRLTVTVYRNTPSPFAVFTRDGRAKVLAGRNAAYLALSDCQVRALDEKAFTFCSKKERIGKGPSYLTFEASSTEERDCWLDLFKCPDMKLNKTTQCCSFLPTIEEYEDSEESSHIMSHGKANLISV
ncbi:Hypothetical predicted protein [Paramuricea clavata]|uniref:Uncharacterized protein n=1 Tax=Paramuricea clavata TaxID=317549 RepID=A0A6S7H6G4_PARCT|nr:Hypothetical predicted protein [Paramuricea clavata]